jgi:hypothetical protein
MSFVGIGRQIKFGGCATAAVTVAAEAVESLTLPRVDSPMKVKLAEDDLPLPIGKLDRYDNVSVVDM